MASSINIGQLSVQSITNNSSINSGATYHNSHNANTTMIGGSFNFGDGCVNSTTNINFGKITIPKEGSGGDSPKPS